MKVYLNRRNNITNSQSNKNVINNSLLNEVYLKQKKNREMLMEEKISKIVNEIKQKLSQGKDIQKIPLDEVKDIDNIIEYILNKNSRKPNDVIVIRQFLISFSNLLEILYLNDKFNDTTDLIYKISASLKKEEIPKNEILFLNGQLGKTFYIILQGEVSVLIPIEYTVQITCSQFYEYMEFLLDNKEYELIRLSFKSNEKIIKERNIQNIKEYEKFTGLLDTSLPSGARYDPTEIDAYLNKFTSFVNNILRYNEQLEEKEREKKEKEKNKKENEEDNSDIENEEEEDEDEKTNEENSEYSSNNDDIRKDKKKKKKKKEEEKDEEKVFDNKYINIKYKFFLWKYNVVCDLGKGKSFGEVALKKGDNRRTATIMTKTDCIFGILEKDDYQLSIKEFVEKVRKINTESIMNSKLFQNYREDLFDTHYFNCFKAIKKYKGDYIFSQNEKRKFIYFIKNGDIQIELYSSWNEMDKILEVLGNKDTINKKNFKNLVYSNEKLEIFCKKRQKFNVSIYSSGEIIGLEEHINPITETFMFNALCISECDIFSLEIEFIEKMLHERTLRNNYNKLNKEKKEKIIQRLLVLKSNILYQYNNMIEDKIIIHNPNMKENKKNEGYENLDTNHSLKDRNIFKTRKKFVYVTPELKTEMNNFSIEKKNINRNLLKINFQNPLLENSLSSLLKPRKKEMFIIPYKTKNFIKDTFYGTDSQTFRESRSKISMLTNNKLELNNFNTKISKIDKKNKTINLFKIQNNKNINNTEYLSTQISESFPKKTEIKFPVKGKVPSLLFHNVKTINQVLDKLISKEKDICYSNKTSKNDKKEYDKYGNKSHRKFISHLELLGFDNIVSKIAYKNKKTFLKNKIGKFKNNDKRKLLSIPKLTNQKHNFNMKKNNY